MKSFSFIDFIESWWSSVLTAAKIFSAMHLARGNHESKSMNKIYGFEGEVRSKLSETFVELFAEVFCCLPLAHVINNKVLVVHGGLFSVDGVKLSDIRAIDRFREPPEEGMNIWVIFLDHTLGWFLFWENFLDWNDVILRDLHMNYYIRDINRVVDPSTVGPAPILLSRPLFLIWVAFIHSDAAVRFYCPSHK